MENTTMKNNLKIAAVGLGWVTSNRHLPTMLDNQQYQIMGVIDKSNNKLKNIANKYNLLYYHQSDNLNNIPWMDEIDAVTIGASPQSHYGLIKSALAQGKHVLTEKPFTMTRVEGEELVALAKENHLTLGIIHNFQFAHSTQCLLRDLQTNRFGKIKAIVAQQLSNPRRRLPTWFETLPLGLFYDESPHFFYLISRLSPGPLSFLTSDVFSSTFGMNTPAAITIQYRCDAKEHGTIPVTVNMNFEAPISEWHLTVYGEEYLGDIDIFRDIYIRLPNDGLHTTATVIRTSFQATWQHWIQHVTRGIPHLRGKLRYGNDTVFERFAKAVLENEPLENINSQDALKIQNMQHEVIENQNRLISTNH